MSEQDTAGDTAGTDGPDDGRHVHHPIAPWWADLGTWGAVALIVLGGVAAVWMFFGLPGTPETPAAGYHQVAKVVAIGLVVAGTGLLGRRRERHTDRDDSGTGADDGTGADNGTGTDSDSDSDADVKAGAGTSTGTGPDRT
ncbi:hypothetical protein [Streptomyces sp. bgisy022]|uniref:hypothetical protein n=1 Tax=Streptomyces sp. bgisy022 TaxID=3413769 RepID=UPI003D72A40F